MNLDKWAFKYYIRTFGGAGGSEPKCWHCWFWCKIMFWLVETANIWFCFCNHWPWSLSSSYIISWFRAISAHSRFKTSLAWSGTLEYTSWATRTREGSFNKPKHQNWILVMLPFFFTSEPIFLKLFLHLI